MKIAPYLLLCGLVSATWSCKNERAQMLPPEEVIRQYQGFIDLNRYAEAKALSTPDEQKRLDAMADFLAMMPNDSTVIHTLFLRIDCRNTSPHAVVCDCLMEDEEAGAFESTFYLVKMNGNWRVDLPLEDVEDMEDPTTAPTAKPMALPQRL